MQPRSEQAAERILLVCAVLSSLITAAILVFMLIMGLPLLAGGRIFTLAISAWEPGRELFGIYPMLLGTLAVAPLALIIALPVSLGTAALIGVAQPRGAVLFVRRFVQLMTGIPTVVYGFVGVFLLVPLIRGMAGRGTGMCVLTAALLLALLVAPTMILFFGEAFQSVPRAYLLAVDAIGADRWQKFCHVILPNAWRGVLGGIVMATGRAFGDTMIALMVAGNAARVPQSVYDPVRTLTSHIALIKAADYNSLEFKSIFACGLALYLVASVLVVLIRRIGRHEAAR
ncbi:ABC transporter permease subunit [bacterium]|nr:ABC transporter permease subunit [bacterium]